MQFVQHTRACARAEQIQLNDYVAKPVAGMGTGFTIVLTVTVHSILTVFDICPRVGRCW